MQFIIQWVQLMGFACRGNRKHLLSEPEICGFVEVCKKRPEFRASENDAGKRFLVVVVYWKMSDWSR
jgi:hypothetical protein